MRHLTKEELLHEIAAGNRTIKGLAAKFGSSTHNMKSILANLEISLKETDPEPEAIIMDNLVASDDSEWDQLYKDYDLEGGIGYQAQFIIAQCKISYGMTAAQARQYMKDNFHYQVIEIKLSK